MHVGDDVHVEVHVAVAVVLEVGVAMIPQASKAMVVERKDL